MDKFTPLHTACRYRFQELCQLLIEFGADLTIEDDKGRTPIQLAQRYNLKLNVNESPSQQKKEKSTEVENQQ